MNYEQRKTFRNSKKWKAFKAKIRLTRHTDYITKQPLTRGWNLHHLDLSYSRYDNLSDPSHFMCLNGATHDIIHTIYKWYKKDKTVIDRIKNTMELMDQLTNRE